MISNTSNNKLKASKSSRDLDDTHRNLDGESCTKISIRPRSEGHNEEKVLPTVVYSSRDSRYKSTMRVRSGSDLRGSKTSNDRRGSTQRARGMYSRKFDSENYSSRKFQESVSVNKSCDSLNITSNYNKYNDYDVKTGISYNLPEDPRISKLLRRLCAETDPDKALTLCSKLQEMIILSDNARYIRRSFNILGENIIDVLRSGPVPCREEAARALGKMGYVLCPDFHRYWVWLVNCYSSEEIEVRALLMKALNETLVLDSKRPSLQNDAISTMEHLQNLLENTHSSAIFTSTVEVIILLSKSYPESLAPLFVDMVDILVGWHLDTEQSKDIKECAAETLQKFHLFWKSDISFSEYILGQFVEDIVAYGDELSQPPSGRNTPVQDGPVTPSDCIKRIAGLFEVFNTVMKSLSGALKAYPFLTECLQKFLKTIDQVIKVQINLEFIQCANESLHLLLSSLKSKVLSSSVEGICNLIRSELEINLQFDVATTMSLLAMISQTIKEVSASLPVILIDVLLEPGSVLLSLRLAKTSKIQNAVVHVYQNMLALRNIPLLQKAYKYMLDDLYIAFKIITNGTISIINDSAYDEIYTKNESRLIILFYLRCLTELANASNSIIAMWALQPSILDLLALKAQPCHEVWNEHQSVQYSILYLLHAHSKKNNNFVGSSHLTLCSQKRANAYNMLGITMIEDETSPTSGHYSIIMNILSKALDTPLPNETLGLILEWSREFFMHSENYMSTLIMNEDFVELLQKLIKCGASIDVNTASKVHACLMTIFKLADTKWPMHINQSLCDLCALHICNNSVDIRMKYTSLLFLLPISITLDSLPKPKTFAKDRSQLIKSIQKWNFQNGSCGEILPLYFKTFMNYMLNGKIEENQWLLEIFQSSWPIKSGNAKLFKSLALCDNRPLVLWSQWESAQLCIANKLRTPLGKPQDTFMSIEVAIKTLARVFTTIDETHRSFDNIMELIEEQKRMRFLLGFMEQLEKAIYNAVEGTAIALPQQDKSVRTFFRTNASTCREWLSRIRCAIMVVGLHSMSTPTCIRQGEALLHEITLSGNYERMEFERIIIKLVSSLVFANETSAILGLYSWIKQTMGKKMNWLKFAAEEASGKYEEALDGYLQLTSGEDFKNFDNQLVSFICDHINGCYTKLGFWNDLCNWKKVEQNLWYERNIKNPMVIPFYDCSVEQCTALSLFEDNDLSYMECLSNWDCLEITDVSKLKHSDCSYNRILAKAESTLLNIALKINSNKELVNCPVDIFHAIRIAEGCIQESIRDPPSEFLTHALLLQNVSYGLQEFLRNNTSVFKISLFDNKHSSTLLNKVLWWTEFFSSLNSNFVDESINLRLETVAAARREGNFKLSKKLLQKHFLSSSDFTFMNGDLKKVADFVIRNSIQIDATKMWNVENARAVSETAKLLHVTSDNRELAIQLAAGASLGICQRIVTSSENVHSLKERASRILLTLAKWVQLQTDKLLTTDLSAPLTRLVTALPDIGAESNNLHDRVVPILDGAVGKLLKSAVRQCPELAKSWNALGNWSYRWGRKMIELGTANLSDSDKTIIKTVLPSDIDLCQMEKIMNILTQTRSIVDEEDIDTNVINTCEMIEAQLINIPCLSDMSRENILMLVDVWKQSQKRMYGYYELAADSYFRYLQLSSANNNEQDCASVSATLRLLRLIVKHAMGLQVVLESGLSVTPTRPWKAITPQLFSRLDHPETYVRKRLSELLCRVAEDAPQLITFPAVVGASQVQKLDVTDLSMHSEANNDDLDDNDCISNVDNLEDNEQEATLNFCFASMVDTLSNQAPDTVRQVQILVSELRRITLLWDELWLTSLVQLNADFTRRISQLENEINRLRKNQNLDEAEKERIITEKYRIIMKQLLFVLEQLHNVSSRTPETPNEAQFQERYLSTIENILENLRQPVDLSKSYQAFWTPIKNLQNSLQQRSHKKTSYNLKMSEISPALFNLRNTVISMPGLHSKVPVTIVAIENMVSVLPTKTKPKKLVFYGSNGKKYTYLFKGVEDLHLDERIMQFLSIANTMMSRKDSAQTYRARHYSVIPLGSRSGLISWVDDVTPIFGIYKRWQQREMLNSTKINGNNNDNKTPTVLRPTELFYNKLNPLLREKGIKNTSNRKDWPLDTLKQVLTELSADTPDDLLSREIWCCSQSAAQWRQAQLSYARSVAVMSVIGYVIGLGDRHLDNILVELGTGEVVHIDYNVCFEKGRTLRVPEKVPFRMTPNLKKALGITGIEGTYRLSCEHVLRSLRRGRETLLTLLEAFVYDPLVDWTTGGTTGTVATGAGGAGGTIAVAGAGGRAARRRMEREVTRDMLAVRFSEIRPEWKGNREDILTQLEALSSIAERLTNESCTRDQSVERKNTLVRSMTLASDAQCDPGHRLRQLGPRRLTCQRQKEAHEITKRSICERKEECERQILAHTSALESVKLVQMANWIGELNSLTMLGINNLNNPDQQNNQVLCFDLIREFLHSAGQTAMTSQCDENEKELLTLAKQQATLTRACIELLGRYSTIVSLYPSSHLARHRTARYAHWASMLLSSESPQICREVVAQFQTEFGALPGIASNEHQQQHVIAYSFRLQTALAEANVRLQRACERMQQMEAEHVIVGEPSSKYEETYMEARNNINHFLRVQDKTAARSLESIVVTTLSSLNQQYIMLETAASAAGECLVDLNTREGDWFLDGLRMTSAVIAEMVSVIPTVGNTDDVQGEEYIVLALGALRSTDTLYQSLHDINSNFQNILLPEILKGVQSEDKSVLSIINSLNDIVLDIGIPVPELLKQLEMHLRFIIMEMDSPHSALHTIVLEIRQKFEALLNSCGNSEINTTESDKSSSTCVLSHGHMLLIGFWGMCDKLQRQHDELYRILQQLTVGTLPSWRKIDQIRDAKNMAAQVLNESTRGVLKDIFFIKSLQMILEVFNLALQGARVFKGPITSMHNMVISPQPSMLLVLDDEKLIRPVRRFTADYASRQLLGVMPHTLALTMCFIMQYRLGVNIGVEVELKDVGAESKVPLDDICRKAVDKGLRNSLYTTTDLSQASTLCGTLEHAWKRREANKVLQQNVTTLRREVERLQVLVTAHHWLHEDNLISSTATGQITPPPIVRAAFMLELRKASQTLIPIQQRITECRETQSNLVQSAEQRLKWAAGANPALAEVTTAFENAVKQRDEELVRLQRTAAEVAKTCNALLHHEAMRTRTSESAANDQAFLDMVSQWEKSCTLQEGCKNAISPLEESLFEMLDPEGCVDDQYLANVSALLKNMINEIDDEIETQQNSLSEAEDILQDIVNKLRSHMSQHNQLTSDIRALLKNMLKSDGDKVTGLRDYLSRYKRFLEVISAISSAMYDKENVLNSIYLVKGQVQEAQQLIGGVFDDIFLFEADNGKSNNKRPPLLRQSSVQSINDAKEKTPRLPEVEQKRNAYAVSVWRRVRLKLEGRDPDPMWRCTPAEQVDFIIREATSLDNLALLYEGWTPWV